MSTSGDTTTTTTTTIEAAEAAAGLRQLADLIEANPELADLVEGNTLLMAVGERWGSDESVADRFARLARMLGGTRTKSGDGTYFWVGRRFGPLTAEIFTARNQVCERVVVGVETVEVPDPDAPKVTVEREVVEWQCSPVLRGVA